MGCPNRSLIGSAQLAALLALAVGCADRNERILGDWRLHVEYPKSKTEAAGPRPWVFASITMTFKPGGKFLKRTGPIPMEGSFKLNGSRLEIVIETVAGLPFEEWIKQDLAGTEASTNRVSGSLSQDGTRIEINHPKEPGPPELYMRDPFNVPPEGPTAVAGPEREWVGTYRSRVKKERVNDNSRARLHTFSTFTLRADKSFVFFFISDMFGTWHVEGSKLKLRTQNVNGWSESSTSNTMTLTKSGDALDPEGDVDIEFKRE